MQSFNEWAQKFEPAKEPATKILEEGKKAVKKAKKPANKPAKKPAKKKEWKTGAKLGIKGTVKAALDHHPDKFGKGPGKLNPYAIFTAKAKKGMKSHYKNQKSTLKGTPKKKAEFKNENRLFKFSDWVAKRVTEDTDPSKRIVKQAPSNIKHPLSGLKRKEEKLEKAEKKDK